MQELAKKDAKKEKEEREKRKKHRRSSSMEEWIPQSPLGEAVLGPVPTSMKIKPNPSLGRMAQSPSHGERRPGMWWGKVSCACRHTHVLIISSIGEQIGERGLRIHTVLNFGHCEYSDAVA